MNPLNLLGYTTTGLGLVVVLFIIVSAFTALLSLA